MQRSSEHGPDLVATATHRQGLEAAPALSFDALQVFEKFTKESTSLLDELSIINESDKSSSMDKDKYEKHTRTHTLSLFLSGNIHFIGRNPELCVFVLQIS